MIFTFFVLYFFLFFSVKYSYGKNICLKKIDFNIKKKGLKAQHFLKHSSVNLYVKITFWPTILPFLFPFHHSKLSYFFLNYKWISNLMFSFDSDTPVFFSRPDKNKICYRKRYYFYPFSYPFSSSHHSWEEKSSLY